MDERFNLPLLIVLLTVREVSWLRRGHERRELREVGIVLIQGSNQNLILEPSPIIHLEYKVVIFHPKIMLFQIKESDLLIGGILKGLIAYLFVYLLLRRVFQIELELFE